MVFAYQGFTHESGRRCFLFNSVEANVPAMAFTIEVDLRLFSQYKIPVQDGPSFCLQMLTRASAIGSSNLDKLRRYEVVGEDFQPMVVEREKKEAEKTMKWREQKRIRTATMMQAANAKQELAVAKSAV
jgi:hypothetical protein